MHTQSFDLGADRNGFLKPEPEPDRIWPKFRLAGSNRNRNRNFWAFFEKNVFCSKWLKWHETCRNIIFRKILKFFSFWEFWDLTTVVNRAAMSCDGNTIRSHGLWCSGTVTWSHVMESVSKVRNAISLVWQFGSKVRKAISPNWKFWSNVRKAILLIINWKVGKFEKKMFCSKWLKSQETCRNIVFRKTLKFFSFWKFSDHGC